MDALVNIIYKFLFRITAVNNDLNGIVIESKNITVAFDAGHKATGQYNVSKTGYKAIAVAIGHTGSEDIYPFEWWIYNDGIFHYGLKSTWHTGNVIIKVKVTYIKTI